MNGAETRDTGCGPRRPSGHRDERGRPHLVPCCFALDGDIVYSAVDAKTKSTVALRRLATLRANPDTALLVDFYGDRCSGALASMSAAL
jgi:hypothetical protein